jgi:predicted patatin/cPLA2 family phospholipase
MAMSKSALVVEGGGMRGIFAAGVLDEFLAQKYDPFDLYLGVSAGACNLSSQVAGQAGRNRRVYTQIMSRPPFFSFKKFLLGGHYMDLDWFWETFTREDPLDYEAAARHCATREFVVGCTSVETGRPVYLVPTRDTWSAALKMSCALPILYRTPLCHNGERLVDGGVSDAIPVEEAVRRGATRLVVIRSRPAHYVKKEGIEDRAIALAFLRHAAFRQAVSARAANYQRAVDFIAHPPPGVEIVSIAPAQPLQTTRTSRDRVALEADYQLGRELGRRYLADGRL